MFPSTHQSGNRVANVFGDVENVFNQLFEKSAKRAEVNYHPAWDIAEHADAFEIGLELPGVQPADVKVEFENGVLTISGEKTVARPTEEVKFHRSERPVGKFHRTVQFDTAVVVDEIDAQFENGLLTIRLPKAEKAVARKIEIKTAK